jgi:hypothetical protein
LKNICSPPFHPFPGVYSHPFCIKADIIKIRRKKTAGDQNTIELHRKKITGDKIQLKSTGGRLLEMKV